VAGGGFCRLWRGQRRHHGRWIGGGGGGARNGVAADGADDGGTANDWGDTDDGSTVELGLEGRRGRGGAHARPRSAMRPTSGGSCVPDRWPSSRDCGVDDRMSACGARGGRAGRRGRPIREERGILRGGGVRRAWRRRAEGFFREADDRAGASGRLTHGSG
jgi:hypothetical protein